MTAARRSFQQSRAFATGGLGGALETPKPDGKMGGKKVSEPSTYFNRQQVGGCGHVGGEWVWTVDSTKLAAGADAVR